MSRIGDVFEIRDGAEGIGDLIRVCSVILLFALSAFLGALVSFDNTTKQWQSECIKRGVAEYDSVTGTWMWKRTFDVLPE